MEKPKVIERVNFLLGLSIIINIIFGIFNLCVDMRINENFNKSLIIAFIIAIVIKAFWYFKIYKGSLIAKNLYIWIGTIALPIIFVLSFYIMYDKSFFDGLEHLILSAIGLVVIFLLSTNQAKSWFN